MVQVLCLVDFQAFGLDSDAFTDFYETDLSLRQIK